MGTKRDIVASDLEDGETLKNKIHKDRRLKNKKAKTPPFFCL